jgi:RNA polymerase sigma-70 factor (ECF subfamily)
MTIEQPTIEQPTIEQIRGTAMEHDPASTFEQHRPVLLGLAYRLLGSMWDAEDVVQDAYLRWSRADRSDVREPRGYLITVVTRLALDQLRSARVTREAYPGPWLPEPVATDELGPLDTAELRDTVAFATVHLMERLSPPERAVFVLREAFTLPYDEIAPMVSLSVPACRQTYVRARRRLADGPDRFQPSRQDQERLLTGFLQAARTGDLTALTRLLAEDVTHWSDGGGLVRSALRPVLGRRNVVAFWIGICRRNVPCRERLIEVNGQLGLLVTFGGRERVLTLDVRDGRIRQVFSVSNPDKVSALVTPIGR